MPDAANIKTLTALRFFAALWVVMFHYWPHLAVGFTPVAVTKGYLGVEAFFILSGFILCHVYLQGFGQGTFRYGDFLWNRLARVYPLHLATLIGVGLMALAATLAGITVGHNVISWEALPANILLIHAWGVVSVAGWNHPSWSISAEWFAYLTFPVFAFAAWKLRARPVLAVGLALGLIAILYPSFERLAGFPLTRATINWGALRIVPCFAYGCALHAVWRSGVIPARLAAPIAILAALAVVITVQLGAYDAIIVAMLGAMVLGLACLSASGSTFASQSIFVYLGEISYSTYMICIPWGLLSVNAAKKLLHIEGDQLPLAIWIVIVVALVPLSALSYHLIESPARNRMKSWAKTWKARRPVAVGA